MADSDDDARGQAWPEGPDGRNPAARKTPAAAASAIPVETKERPLSPARQGPFGEIAAGARLTAGWATIPVQLLIYFVSIVPAVIVVIPVMALYVINSGVDPSTLDPNALPEDMYLTLLVVLSVVQFPVWALLVILLVRGFERRSLASAGFRGPNVLGRYGAGFALGVAAVLVLTVFAAFVQPPDLSGEFAAATGFSEVEDPNLGRLLTGPWLLLMFCAVAFFLVQGSCEEIAFRGWMMSTLAARWGLGAAIAVNTIVFGSLHVHLFASGLVPGLFSIAAVTCVGLFMSLWAVYDRSLAGVCGAHGAFNATSVVLGIIAFAAASPEAGPAEVLLDTIEQATATDGEASIAGGLLQLLVFAAFSGFAWWLIMRRAAREAAPKSQLEG